MFSTYAMAIVHYSLFCNCFNFIQHNANISSLMCKLIYVDNEMDSIYLGYIGLPDINSTAACSAKQEQEKTCD